MRLHPSTWAWLSVLALAALIAGMAFGVAAAVIVALAGSGGHHLVVGPRLTCEICVQPFAYWGIRRFQLLDASGRRRWLATRRCWIHRHDPREARA